MRAAISIRLVALALTFMAFLGEAGGQETTNPRSLPVITSRTEFDTLARVYSDKSYPLPHVIFVIDRRDQHRI